MYRLHLYYSPRRRVSALSCSTRNHEVPNPGPFAKLSELCIEDVSEIECLCCSLPLQAIRDPPEPCPLAMRTRRRSTDQSMESKITVSILLLSGSEHRSVRAPF